MAGMIVSPEDFQPLLAPVDRHRRRTLVFRGNEVLVREADFTFADADALDLVPADDARVIPVGDWRETYWRTTWIEQ